MTNKSCGPSNRLTRVQFFILAPYVAIEAARALANGSHPEESIVGIALAASSVVIMPFARPGEATDREPDRVVGHGK